MHKLLISIWLNQVLVFSSSQVFFPDSFGSQECVALTPTCSSSLPSSQDLSQAAPAMEFPKCSLSVCTGGVWAASRVSGRSLCCTTCSPLRADNREFSDVSLDEQMWARLTAPSPSPPGCSANMQAQGDVLRVSVWATLREAPLGALSVAAGTAAGIKDEVWTEHCSSEELQQPFLK